MPAAFFPGLRVTFPSAFSSAPSTLSLIFGFLLWCVAGARFFVTPAPVVLFGAALFVPVALRFRSGVVEIDATTRGLELPVDARVAAMTVCIV